MKQQRELLDYLHDVAGATKSAESFVVGMGFDDFAKDEKTIFAVVRAIEIIGEAAKNIPTLVRRRYPQVPWKKMVGVRNKVIHEYFGVDMEALWKTVKEDMPGAMPLVGRVLAELSEEERGSDAR